MPKILVICSGYPSNDEPYRNIYVKEQIDAIKSLNPIYEFEIFEINRIRHKSNYLKAIFKLRSFAMQKKYDLFHAYFGLSALTCVWQNITPVIVTYAGCDININYHRFYAKFILQHKVAFSIFVSRSQSFLMNNPSKSAIVPLGIDFSAFYLIDKNAALQKLGWTPEKKYVVFASDFLRIEKNIALAQQAIAQLKDNTVVLLELKNYSREEVNYILNAADLLLLTSFREGSPLIIKEAMACNLPIVSTDVGDVKEVIQNTAGCYITSFDPDDVSSKIKAAIDYGKRTNGREMIEHLEKSKIAQKITIIYESVLNGR